MAGGDELLRRERDFLAALVDLGQHEEPETLIPAALALLVGATDALHGHLEILDDVWREVRWSADEDRRVDGLFDARRTVSRGIIAEARTEGTLIHTACALADERFQELDSVRTGTIEAVLCAPVGRAGDAEGAIYLQGRPGGGPFSEMDERMVERFVRALEPLVTRFTRREGSASAAPRPRLDAPGLVAKSPTMASVLELLAVVAKLETPLLLLGPSGSGKSFLARAIHGASRRRDQPLVEVNCAAVPEALFENEVFGAGPGAHSTAPRTGLVGKVQAAEGGTLFLDEVGAMGLAVQAKLLHLLQDGRYFRLGESVARLANVRVLAAANVDLRAAVREGRFREDLYYRLSVLEVAVPALDQRQDDLCELASRIASAVVAKHDFGSLRLSSSALRAIERARWPGNVRQLQHAVEAGAIAAVVARASAIEPEHLGLESPVAAPAAGMLESRLDAYRARIVMDELSSNAWNVGETARALGVARSYLYKLIRRYDIRREA